MGTDLLQPVFVLFKKKKMIVTHTSRKQKVLVRVTHVHKLSEVQKYIFITAHYFGVVLKCFWFFQSDTFTLIFITKIIYKVKGHRILHSPESAGESY